MKIVTGRVVGDTPYKRKDGSLIHIIHLIFPSEGTNGFCSGQVISQKAFEIDRDLEILYGYSARFKRFEPLGIAERS